MEEEEELVIASSSVDADIGCWALRSGAERHRYRSCASPPHGLACVGRRFIACSQLRDSTTSGSILYWSWNKPQPAVKTFPSEPIGPLASNTDGTYLVGGGLSGSIFLWEVASGTLLKKWHAHYRAVTCLVFSDDESLLISGAEDGCVRVWSLCKLFDNMGDMVAKRPYELSFSEHTLRVTDIVSGSGGCSAIIVSSSEDRTCKVWSLSQAKLLRTIVFPSIIDAIALDPAEHVFYAGCKDGKIYIGALNAESTSSNNYGMHIIGALFDNSKAVTCLAFSMDGISLVSGSDDGSVRVWDTKTCQVVHVFKQVKSPINNVLVLKQPSSLNPQPLSKAQGSVFRKHAPSLLPPPLDKYINSMDVNVDTRPLKTIKFPRDELDYQYISAHVMMNQMKELQVLLLYDLRKFLHYHVTW